MINRKIIVSISIGLMLDSYNKYFGFTADKTPKDVDGKKVEMQLIIDKKTVEKNLGEYVKAGLKTEEYGRKELEIVDKYTSGTPNALPDGDMNANYYNPSTGAIIEAIAAPSPTLHGGIMFNKAGWNIIKEIITMGGGATSIGCGIAALLGAATAITGPIAAILGGVVVLETASVNLQFALGSEYAFIYY